MTSSTRARILRPKVRPIDRVRSQQKLVNDKKAAAAMCVRADASMEWLNQFIDRITNLKPGGVVR